VTNIADKMVWIDQFAICIFKCFDQSADNLPVYVQRVRIVKITILILYILLGDKHCSQNGLG
jgi:hypothetical protein